MGVNETNGIWKKIFFSAMIIVLYISSSILFSVGGFFTYALLRLVLTPLFHPVILNILLPFILPIPFLFYIGWIGMKTMWPKTKIANLRYVIIIIFVITSGITLCTLYNIFPIEENMSTKEPNYTVISEISIDFILAILPFMLTVLSIIFNDKYGKINHKLDKILRKINDENKKNTNTKKNDKTNINNDDVVKRISNLEKDVEDIKKKLNIKKPH